MIPYNVAFAATLTNLSVAWVVIDRVIDSLFIVDILFNFRTTFINPKTNLEIVDPKRIAKNYFYSQKFWVDLLASIPFEIFFELAQGDAEANSNTTVQL